MPIGLVGLVAVPPRAAGAVCIISNEPARPVNSSHYLSQHPTDNFESPISLSLPMASTSPSTAQASNNSTPALGAELSKVEARQAKNLWVTSRVIDGLMERIARAKRELEDAHVSTSVRTSTTSSPLRTPSTTAKSPSGKEKSGTGEDEKGKTNQKMDVEKSLGGGAVAVLSQLSKDVESMKPLDSVGSEHKNFHATISKLAKAAEKVCMGWGKAMTGEFP